MGGARAGGVAATRSGGARMAGGGSARGSPGARRRAVVEWDRAPRQPPLPGAAFCLFSVAFGSGRCALWLEHPALRSRSSPAPASVSLAVEREEESRRGLRGSVVDSPPRKAPLLARGQDGGDGAGVLIRRREGLRVRVGILVWGGEREERRTPWRNQVLIVFLACCCPHLLQNPEGAVGSWDTVPPLSPWVVGQLGEPGGQGRWPPFYFVTLSP